MALAIREALSTQGTAHLPVDAALKVLDADLEQLQSFWRNDPDGGRQTFLRFTAMLDSTDSLRAAQRDMMDRLVQVAATALADRAGVSAEDPEPQIVAHAILGLWPVQYAALRRLTGTSASTDELVEAVRGGRTPGGPPDRRRPVVVQRDGRQPRQPRAAQGRRRGSTQRRPAGRRRPAAGPRRVQGASAGGQGARGRPTAADRAGAPSGDGRQAAPSGCRPATSAPRPGATRAAGPDLLIRSPLSGHVR